MTSKRILVVDDDQTTAEIIKMKLHKIGFSEVQLAASAELALEIILQAHPAIVLMDINLGAGMDGIEAAHLITRDFKIPLIYVTAYADEDTLNRAKRTFPDGYINKPLRESDLRTTIALTLERSEAQTLASKTTKPAIGSNNKRDSQSPKDFLTSMYSEALDNISIGVMLLNEELNIYYLNKSASAYFDSETAQLSVLNGSLNTDNNKSLSDIQRAILADEVQTLTLSTTSTQPLHILTAPLHDHYVNYGQGRPTSIMYLFNTLQDLQSMERVLVDLYQLSPSESKLVARLMVSPRLDEASAELGIKITTARTHMKHIYQKTGVHGLPELLNTITSGPASVMTHFEK